MPLVSVVMAIHNCEQYVQQAIDSIIFQSFKDFEFIIINDASTDRTEDIIKSNKDPRIIRINNKENIGQTKSLNKGINSSRGKYIARMDGDDVSHLNRLGLQVEFMESHPKVGAVGTWLQLINDRNQPILTLRYPLILDLKRFLLLNLLRWPCLAHPSVMIRKDVFTHIGLYDEKYFISQDYDLWLRVASEYLIRNIPRVLLSYRQNKQSLSRKEIDKTRKEIEDIIFSQVKSYLPDLGTQDQIALTNFLMSKKQINGYCGGRVFEIFDAFFQAVMERQKTNRNSSKRRCLYLSDLAKLYYLPSLIITNKRLTVKSFLKFFPKYRRWILSPRFAKAIGCVLFR